MQKASKHKANTLGPLTLVDEPGRTYSDGMIDRGGYRIDAPDIEQVAFVWRENTRWSSCDALFGAQEATAYARLFAAAPDLLEALKGVLRVADRQTVEFDAARAAIAKAEAPDMAVIVGQEAEALS